MKSKLWLVTIVMIAALALSACGTPALSGTLSAAPALNQVPANTVTAPGKSTAALGSVSDLEQTLEQIYTQVNPSVVAIQVVEKAGGIAAIPFFNDPGQNPGQGVLRRKRWFRLLGQDRHIVTVSRRSSADKISVVLSTARTSRHCRQHQSHIDLAVISESSGGPAHCPSRWRFRAVKSANGRRHQQSVRHENTMTVGFVSAIDDRSADGTTGVSYDSRRSRPMPRSIPATPAAS
jgi:hypothetical protein